MEEDKKALFYIQEVLPCVGDIQKAKSIFEAIDIVAKYVNTMHTEIFDKGRHLGK